MKHKLVIQFILFLVLALFSAHQLGLLKGVISDELHRKHLKEMRARTAEFESMKKTEEALYSRLNDARTTLTGVSAAYLPDPTDPFAWASRQVQYLTQESGARFEDMEAGSGPRIRAQRGQDHRQFTIYRCTVELSGSLDQLLEFARIAEERNAYLIVSGLSIGPERQPDLQRRGQVIFDWPIWRTTDLRNELLAELEPL